MPFKRGQARPPGAGRKKGVKGKRVTLPVILSRDVSARLAELGCDPIEGLALLAMDDNVEDAIRRMAFADLASFVYAKRKAIEHTGLGIEVNILNVSNGKQTLEARILGIRERLGVAGNPRLDDGSGSQ